MRHFRGGGGRSPGIVARRLSKKRNAPHSIQAWWESIQTYREAVTHQGGSAAARRPRAAIWTVAADKPSGEMRLPDGC